MATTTNYGWTTPDDTALVKDGAAAIRTLGTSVDTTTKNLNPSTTLGDIEYRSSTANTNTRLGIGSNAQVLTVAAGVPSWATLPPASSMTLISTTSLSGASVTLSSIPATYRNIYLVIYGATNATANGRLRIAVNNTTNTVQQVFTEATGASGGAANANNDYAFEGNWARTVSRTDANNSCTVTFFDYANTSAYKTFISAYGAKDTNNDNVIDVSGGIYRSNSAISSLVISNTGGNFSTGTVLLYGVS
jgi:hypothetical protein